MKRLNKEWHLKHPMPKNATVEERINWHMEHIKNCSCRGIPEGLKKEMRKMKEKVL